MLPARTLLEHDLAGGHPHRRHGPGHPRVRVAAAGARAAPAAGRRDGGGAAGRGRVGRRRAWSATVQRQRVDARALSPVGAFNLVGAYEVGPLAFLAAGLVAAVLGARAVLGFGAAWAVFGSLAVLAVPPVRLMTWLTAPAAEPPGGPPGEPPDGRPACPRPGAQRPNRRYV